MPPLTRKIDHFLPETERETGIYVYVYIYISGTATNPPLLFLSFSPSSSTPSPSSSSFCSSELLIRKRPHNSYPAADLLDVTIDIIPDIWRKVILYGTRSSCPLFSSSLTIGTRTLFTSELDEFRISLTRRGQRAIKKKECLAPSPWLPNFVNQTEKLTMENR